MITVARRTKTQHRSSRSQQPGIVLGLRYERTFVKALKTAIGSLYLSRGPIRGMSRLVVEHNPWFYYETENEPYPHACCPDVLLTDNELGIAYILEIKYTWVPEAKRKLDLIYCPVIQRALHLDPIPIVVVKRLTSEAPKPDPNLLNKTAGLYQWLEGRPILF